MNLSFRTTRTPSHAMAPLAAGLDPAKTREDAWAHGFTRRRILQGGLGMGVAAVAEQLVTTQVAFGAPEVGSGALVVVFLRGGMDGLSMLVPAEDSTYLANRPGVAVRGPQLITLDRGFGLHPGMAPLRPMIAAGKLAAVPAVATPFLTRSHFQAQSCLERGGSSANSGWLDRLLEQIGPGTAFRALGAGYEVPQSLQDSLPLVMSNVPDFQIAGYDGLKDQTLAALSSMFTGLADPMGPAALRALAVANQVQGLADTAGASTARGFSDDDWGHALASVSSLVKADLGLRVATVDLGGWDMHTAMGSALKGDFFDMTTALATGLAKFFTDLGDHASSTTVLVMSEFGRRVTQNASGGTDHGHGGVAMVLGDGVAGGVKGNWQSLSQTLTSDGDVAGANDYRDLLSEVIMKRFGLSAAQAGQVFPGWSPTVLGVMA